MPLNSLNSIVFLACALTLAACSDENEDVVFPLETADAIANLIANDRTALGIAYLKQGPNGVIIRIEATDLPAGWHGIHLHSIADCSSEDFTSTGGHINPDSREHGLLNANGPDSADLPNIYVHANGSVNAEMFTNRVSFYGTNATPALLDEDGSAIIIHLNEDDHQSQPIGGAGSRIGCGTISSN